LDEQKPGPSESLASATVKAAVFPFCFSVTGCNEYAGRVCASKSDPNANFGLQGQAPFVYSHHLSVPFRELVVDAEKCLPGPGGPSLDDNLIIHGDNLEPLKALLPRYAGKVDVISIDPPYNTGNERWAYNDNVNSPLMKAWLGKVVDKEDLERHDKWLCMMWPGLQLLWDLLGPKGSIWISCDDAEGSRLKIICDEVFGEASFVDTVIWQKNYSPKPTVQQFSSDHDYVLVYAKGGEQWHPGLLVRTPASSIPRMCSNILRSNMASRRGRCAGKPPR
jgi:adenine-specific DNA-methyltransferase